MAQNSPATVTQNSPASTGETLRTNNQTIYNVNTSNVAKLTNTNYLMWSRQVHALFDGYELAGYLDGSVQPPPATITVDGAITINSDYSTWKRQDKLVFSALLGAIDTPVQLLVSRATTAHQIWETLISIFAKPSRGHVKQLRQQLKQWVKGTKTTDEYIQGFITRFDQLAILGKPIDHEDQVEYILEGLSEDYKPVIDQIEAKDVPPSITEIHERLRNQEAKLLALTPNLSAPVSANAVSHRNSNNSRSYNNYRSYNNNRQPFHSPSYNNNNNSRQSRPYQEKCQLCGQQGHSARRCSQYLQAAHASPVTSSNQRNLFPPWQPRANLTVGPNNWLLDSGATHHITSDLNTLSLHKPYTGGDEVLLGDGSSLAITHTGSTSLPSNSRSLALDKILCVPDIHKNLISVYKLCNTNQVSVEFFPAHFQVKDLSSGAPLIQGITKDELYEWPVSSSLPQTFFTSPSPKTSFQSWHSRLGHPNSAILNVVVSTFSLPLSTSNKHYSCTPCFINKSHKLTFADSSITSTRPLQYIFADVWSSPIISLDNFKYYLVLVDHFTRYTWLYPLKQKSQVRATFIAFRSLVEKSFQTQITTLYSDNGGEFIGLRSYLTDNGISHLTTPPHTPEHNGISERKHRHIVETGMTLLSQASIPKTYWPFAFATAVFLINRLPTPNLSLTSPFQKLFNRPPNYTKLRIFGCLCFPWLRPYNSHKLEDKSKPCVFLGYSLTQSAYLCLDTTTNRLYTSRHVRFNETTFPFQLKHNESTPKIATTLSSPPVTHIQLAPSVFPRQQRESPRSVLYPSLPTATTTPAPENQQSHPPSPSLPPGFISSSSSLPSSSTLPSSSDTINRLPITEPSPPPQNPISTTTQITHLIPPLPPSRNLAPQAQSENLEPHVPQPPNRMVTRSQNNIFKPNCKYSLTTATKSNLSPEPTTVNQAMRDPNWRNAMSEEFDSQVENNTWDLVPYSPEMNIIGCRWVFKIKTLSNGALDRYKARLVAKGFHQKWGLDFSETFSPVIKSTTIHLVVGIAVGKSWPIKQVDINTAFLQGTLTEEVYMSQPPAFIDKDRPNHVCRLKKAIYGLRQAPRAWYTELRNYLLQAGFTNSLGDTSLFIYHQDNHLAYLLVYVDDIIVTGNSDTLVDIILSSLADRFSIKDPTDLNYFLGIEITRSSHGLHMMQRKYIVDLLTKQNMLDANAVPTPLSASPRLTLHTGSPLAEPTQYRTVIGSLQYLSFTRPDIAYAVSLLSQFMHRPTTDHWVAAKRVLRYLAGTVSHGIFFNANNSLQLHAFSDADWAGDNEDFLSTNGYIVYLGGHPISWSSKKQKGVARSSTEAEYRAVANTSAELLWICSLLTELHVTLPSAPIIYCDNIGATYLCANPVFHSRMKHIALDYHFVREQIQASALKVAHVSTKDQLADTFTKPLPRTSFHSSKSKIGVIPLPPS